MNTLQILEFFYKFPYKNTSYFFKSSKNKQFLRFFFYPTHYLFTLQKKTYGRPRIRQIIFGYGIVLFS